MDKNFMEQLKISLKALKDKGLYKGERVITSKQGSVIQVAGKELINLCSNNYLGLSGNKEIANAAKNGLDTYGYGLSSVRFICGTQDVHKTLEKRLSEFLGTEDTILYSSCFDANGGLFETILGEEDAVISDELNHASIIDGIRLSKAKRFRYRNSDMDDLEVKLKEASSARFRLIATDGVFSMDGTQAPIDKICDLADKYQALVMVDDSHAVGIMGRNGRGTIIDRVDIVTGTLGKALGGASGGYTSGRKEIIEWLRNGSRPYLFSNTLAPCIASASIRALEVIVEQPELRIALHDNTRYFREKLSEMGFHIVPGKHPIIPIMLGDAKLSKSFAEKMMEKGIYVVSFSYPVVPMGKARIRTQMSAVHTRKELDLALEAFYKIGKELHVIPPSA